MYGPSTAEQYVQVMRRGCKCVEIDTWDKWFHDGPVVKHGYTPTTRIPFEEVMQAIHENFDQDFPLLISIEQHCSVANQALMAEVL